MLYHCSVRLFVFIMHKLIIFFRFLNHLPFLFSCENGSKVRRVWLQQYKRRKKGRRKCVVNTFQLTCGTILLQYVSRGKTTPFPPWQKCSQNNLVESLHYLPARMVQNRKTRTLASWQEYFRRHLS